MQIQGATAVVTGGQRGIGKAIVDELLSRGAAKVYATARAPKSAVDPRVVSLPLDVTRTDSIAALAGTAQDASIVINNAGIGGGHNLLTAPIDEMREVFETNYFGAVQIARAFAPILARNGGGALVDIHSVLSWASGAGAYGDSKAAFWSATNTLRIDLAAQGTLVTGVHLAYVDTAMTEHLDVPKGDPREVAKAIADGIELDETEILSRRDHPAFQVGVVRTGGRFAHPLTTDSGVASSSSADQANCRLSGMKVTPHAATDWRPIPVQRPRRSVRR